MRDPQPSFGLPRRLVHRTPRCSTQGGTHNVSIYKLISMYNGSDSNTAHTILMYSCSFESVRPVPHLVLYIAVIYSLLCIAWFLYMHAQSGFLQRFTCPLPLSFKSQLCCRAALKSLKFPGLMRQDIVNAMLQEGMALPTCKGEWALLQRDVFTAAAMICRAPFTRDVSEIDQALKRSLSLIVRDSVHREYDFSVSMDSNGEHPPAPFPCLLYTSPSPRD